MFEQQQNTGKSTSLAEKYANAVGQLSDANDRAAHAEHDLQVERITRQDLIDEEVARRVAEAEERIRKELEAQLADKTKELEERNKALDKRESAKVRNRRNPYLKLSYPNGVTLILPADISIEKLRAYISITV